MHIAASARRLSATVARAARRLAGDPPPRAQSSTGRGRALPTKSGGEKRPSPARSGTGRSRRLVLGGVTGALLSLTVATTAFAEINPVGSAPAGVGLLTEATITNIESGAPVQGFIAPADFDPLTGYPAVVPDDSEAHNTSFAGLIRVADPAPGSTRSGLTYCIDLRTSTQIGVNYVLGDWTEANVPNLGYVEHILVTYFPNTNEPAGASSDDVRAAAVQSAIWFFSDRYVVDPESAASAEVRALTEQIVADALTNGPRPEPVAPELTVTPTEMDAPSTGEIVGPFQVSGTVSGVLRTSGGVEVFTDAQGGNRLLDGAEVSPGTTLWARSTTTNPVQGFVVERVSQILTGTVLLFDGTNPDLDAAQKLILAQETELAVRGGAHLRRFAAGSLRLTKTITGEAAGLQGEIVVQVVCTNDDPGTEDQRRVVTFPGGLAAGDHVRTLTGLRAGSTCAITEPEDGDNPLVNLEHDPVIEPPTVVIVEEGTADVSVTNAFVRATGDLKVVKRITGPGAGHQGEIRIRVDCTDDAFDRVLTLPAHARPGLHRLETITGIPTLTRCRVSESTRASTGHHTGPARTLVRPRKVTISDERTSVIVVKNYYDKCKEKHGRSPWPTFPAPLFPGLH
ncbi:thioester domain-containing protein [Actinocorallia sp. API 0066]|uniref:thioester domain-containing protein n=1 Tax=Actinocorallia sp. API 0066 TaxID=2896846 RepID=UPI001E5EAAA2|nr:thioester domain-containing protein [Actinocorallia sp. API 0066]MCD0452658.1 thioester domain-containing protein [Actinocorallia sp. API 0066]